MAVGWVGVLAAALGRCCLRLLWIGFSGLWAAREVTVPER